MRDPLTIENIASPDEDARRAAQLAVCAHATDAADADALMKMLGIHPSTDGEAAHCRRCGELMARRGLRLRPGAFGMCHLCTDAQLRASQRARL